jgi:ribosomal protein L37E
MLAFHGNIDSKSSTLRRCGNRAKRRDKYECSSMPFALQVSTRKQLAA